MINLSPLRYSRVLKRHQGPIERIEYGRVRIHGKECYQANAYLSEHLNLQRSRQTIFGNSDGSGTHQSAMVARHMAISEAMERWAYFFTRQAGEANVYGYDVDKSSSGMAAYPGLFKRESRERALAEAVERYCLVQWWNGDLTCMRIKSRLHQFEGLELENPLSKHHVVVLWRKSEEGFYSYGFASGVRLDDAYWRAAIELERSQAALRLFYIENPGFGEDDLSILNNYMERRMAYYSLPAGYSEFENRLKTSPISSAEEQPHPLIDKEIEGPWARYATVWRILFPVATHDHLIPQMNTFYW